MIKPEEFYAELKKLGVGYFVGVPDSLLKSFCACLMHSAEEGEYWITANEGNAIGMAIGYHLASKKLALVYMQNSGLGNTLNPLASMADPLVYSVPMLLLIGWRGEILENGEQLKDEPQHKKQGRVTLSWLEASGIPYEILPTEQAAAAKVVAQLTEKARTESRPVALIVRKDSFDVYTGAKKKFASTQYPLTREAAMEIVLAKIAAQSPVVATTGMISRELFELREKNKQSHKQDFLVVGAMGHATSIVGGLLQGWKNKNADAYCFDGDGAFLMHLGAAPILAQIASPHFKHVIFNNAAHDSVGGQPTIGFAVDFCGIARASGYTWTKVVHDEAELKNAVAEFTQARGPALLEIRVQKGNRADLGRPTLTSNEMKTAFMNFLQE